MATPLRTRLLLLLEHLSQTKFAGLPPKVGLKTAILAREMGAVEWSGSGYTDWKFRLTPEGAKLKRALRKELRSAPR